MKQNIIQATPFELKFFTIQYDKSKSFFNYETIVGPVIAVIKKTLKSTGSNGGFKAVVSRKKRKGDVLEESIDIEKKCLIEKTSVDYGESGTFTEGDPDQTPKSLHIKTKKVLKKPLDVIDYNTVNAVSVRKSFALNIDFVVITEKSSQEKLSFVRKLFSGVNGFGGASTSSKFGEIIWATFTSEKAMMTAEKLANDRNIVINTDLKHPNNNHTNRTIVIKKISMRTSMEAVRAAISEFGLIKSIKIQLVGLWQKAIIELEDQNQADLLASKWSIFIGKDANFRDEFKVLLYTLSVGTNAHDLWDFVGSVGGKTCIIDHNPVSYTRAHCATVCFGSESDLVNAMAAIPVIKKIGLCWSHLSLVLCSVCRIPGHISLNCVLVKVGSTLKGRKTPLFGQDQVKLVTIYAKKSMPISHPLVFSGKTWMSVVGVSSVHNPHSAGSLLGSDKVRKPLPSVAKNLDMYLTNIESSLISLVRQINELAKRLDSLVLAVLQSSPGCQLPVTFPSQNQGKDIVMGMGLSETTSDRTATASVRDSFVSLYVAKLENMLEGLAALVLSLSAYFNGLVLAGITGTELAIPLISPAVQIIGDNLKINSVLEVQPHPENVNSQQTGINNIQEKRPKTSDGIEVVKKSVYQYIENRINNYLFGNYNISEVRSNLYNNLAHYSQLETENLNKTSNKGKNKLKQYSNTTPNTLTLPKTTAKHLQTPEQGTSSKLPLTITLFSASLAQAQTPNSPLNRFARPEDFTLLRSPIRQQESLQTSSNLLDFLAENQSEHSETAANEENKPEISEEELIDSENKEDKITTYIAKISEFNGENIETSLQEWLDQVTKARDANGWNAARMLRTILYFLKETAGE
ncbi:hypothetical protein G9A89_003152 [Geosiphon pyriformis]|nr:hypothetical protein G9A89_003152 [Geosiphon pyriformis]